MLFTEKLSDKAQQAYDSYSPLRIIHYINIDSGKDCYSLEGVIDRDNMTIQELNETLESLWEEMMQN